MNPRRIFVTTLVIGLALTACATSTMNARNGEMPSGFPPLNQAAELQRLAAMQRALEHNVSGESTVWTLSNQVGGSVVPLETVSSQENGWCRAYQEIIIDDSQRYRLLGIACRRSGPFWLVLAIRSYTETNIGLHEE